MKAHPIDATRARRELPEALRSAVKHLRERGDFNFLNDEPEIFTTFELATLVQELADRLPSDDESVGRRF
jgi:hypothetical protein